MTASLRKLLSGLLAQIPTVLTLAVLGGVLWWGYVWDWTIPRLPELLGGSETKKTEEKKSEENKEGDHADKMPLVSLPSEEAMERAGILLAPVERQVVGEYVTGQGEIDFDQDHYAHLSTRASGTVWSVHKHAGDQVKKGDVLALVACPELASIKFNLQQTLLLIETRKRLYNRLRSAGEATSGQALDAAEGNLREANIRLSNEQQSLQNLGLSIRLEELRKLNDAQITSRLRTLGLPDSLLQRLDENTLTSNLLPMTAPFDGVVVTRDIVIGEVVSPSTPQFVLADLSRLWIRLHLRLEDAHKLAVGQDAVFHLDGANFDAPPAKLTFISPEVDEKTRTVVARAEVPNPKGDLRPHTFGSADILVGKEERLTVPNEALQVDGDSQLVFVRGESVTEFQPVRVKPGPRHDKFTEISADIEAGQKADDIKAGQMVAVAGTRMLLSEMRKGSIEGGD